MLLPVVLGWVALVFLLPKLASEIVFFAGMGVAFVIAVAGYGAARVLGALAVTAAIAVLARWLIPNDTVSGWWVHRRS